MSFPVTFSEPGPFRARFSQPPPMKAEFSPYIEVPVVDYYEGSYDVTPAPEAQIIPIRGKTGRQDITVGPIPSNYGLVTWDGSTLTVS